MGSCAFPLSLSGFVTALNEGYSRDKEQNGAVRKFCYIPSFWRGFNHQWMSTFVSAFSTLNKIIICFFYDLIYAYAILH